MPLETVHPSSLMSFAQAPRTIALALDDSPQSEYALAWTLQHLLTEGDTLHIITVAVPVGYPVSEGGSCACCS